MKILQRTIKTPVETTGIGLHSGEQVLLRLVPAPENTGIVFRRTDLEPVVEIKSNPNLVKETTLCTGLNCNGVRVQTIEHLMATLASYGIDNIYIELNSSEIPIMDGSSADFVTLVKQAGIVAQKENKKFIRILKPVRVEIDDKFAELTPATNNRLNIDYTINFNHPAISKEESHFTLVLTTPDFVKELSEARTFGFLKDIEALKNLNLCRGGSLDNAIVLDEDKIVNEEGLRFSNEFVRHKMLDSIGDLYICNHNIIGNFTAYKSGHHLNNLLLCKLFEEKDAFEYVEFDQVNINAENTDNPILQPNTSN